MKKEILSSGLTVFLLFLVFSGFSQDHDLIVTEKGDSIVCRIDSITDTHIFFEMKNQNKWIHTHIGLTDISEYKRNAIVRKQYRYKAGTSVIAGPVQEIVSFRDIQKNSVYVGIGSISYSRMIPGDRVGFTFSGGLSFIATAFDEGIGLMVETTLIIGNRKHFFEPGIMGYIDPNIGGLMFRFGYRYQGPEGFLFRVAPMIGYMDEIGFLPSASIGYSF